MKRTTSFSHAKMLMILDKIPFFRDFTKPEQEKIVDHAHFYVAEPDEKIIEQGDLDTAFYILMSGQANVTLDDHKEPLAAISPGNFFGEMSFVLNIPRSTNVIAGSLCIMLEVDRRLMGRLPAEIREKFKDQIIQKMARIIQDFNKKSD